MPKFLIQANYKPEGLKGVLKEGGTGRRKAVEQMSAAFGGKVEAFYFAFGDTDAFVVVDAPDNVTAAAVAMATPVMRAESRARCGCAYRSGRDCHRAPA